MREAVPVTSMQPVGRQRGASGGERGVPFVMGAFWNPDMASDGEKGGQ